MATRGAVLRATPGSQCPRPRESRRRFLQLLALSSVACGILCHRLAPEAAAPRRPGAGTVALAGEVPIGGEADARSVGAEMLREARLALDGEGWQREERSSAQILSAKRNMSLLDDFLVESTELAGPLGRFGLRLFRGRCTVPFPARALYDFLVTPAGYAAIDPFSKPDDFDNALVKFSWPERPGAKLQLEFFEMRVPRMFGVGLRDREGLVLNVHDPVEMAFVSKTVTHSAVPGGSRYQDSQPVDQGSRGMCRRAAGMTSIQVLPVNETHCVLRNLLFWDFCGGVPASAANVVMPFSFEQTFQRIVGKAHESDLR